VSKVTDIHKLIVPYQQYAEYASSFRVYAFVGKVLLYFGMYLTLRSASIFILHTLRAVIIVNFCRMLSLDILGTSIIDLFLYP